MWLHIPESCRYAAALPVLTWASEQHCQALASSVTWRGKPSAWRTWSKRCGKVSWMKHLSGTMLLPSTASRGVAVWISSLAESPASPTALPADRLALTMSETCGQPLLESLGKSNPLGCSWKTSRDSSPSLPGFGESQTAWKDWVTQLRRRCSLLRDRLARAIGESECSFWPTPTARDPKGRDPKRASGPSLPQLCHDLGRLDLAKSARFRETLMGWPIGWTAFGPVEMASYRARLQSRLWCCIHGLGGGDE